ncbi:hypothetical protein HPB51_012313 [Rhipicephalus microplus]|uniref:Transmembrane protein n=1 Tax=Rhipicephalus microplus TaxID=6941 RepID=A0A9J6DA27_RHIMP|nr:hypothetical protein HPB51_012313 [Rhipicephalus microplus]
MSKVCALPDVFRNEVEGPPNQTIPPASQVQAQLENDAEPSRFFWLRSPAQLLLFLVSGLLHFAMGLVVARSLLMPPFDDEHPVSRFARALRTWLARRWRRHAGQPDNSSPIPGRRCKSNSRAAAAGSHFSLAATTTAALPEGFPKRARLIDVTRLPEASLAGSATNAYLLRPGKGGCRRAFEPPRRLPAEAITTSYAPLRTAHLYPPRRLVLLLAQEEDTSSLFPAAFSESDNKDSSCHSPNLIIFLVG